MSKIFCISDIHGCLAEFREALELVDLSGDNMLVLLGDYIHGGPDPYGVLDAIMDLEQQYGPEKVVVLVGNHEDMAMDGRWPIARDSCVEEDDDLDDEKYLLWMQGLRRYYATKRQIFVHAGIDEDAGELWEWATDDFTFTEKYPAETGKFSGGMDIVAGHIGTAEIVDDPCFHDIYWDGESHYYIDGTVLESGVIPALMIDTETNRYYQVRESGAWPILPYGAED